MKLRYLGWSGVEIEHDGQTLLIDYIENGTAIFSDRQFAQPSKPGKAIAALVTHLHGDHADPAVLKKALAKDAPVFRPEPTPGNAEIQSWTKPVEDAFHQLRLPTHIMVPWTECQVGPFRIIAVPAVDGLGDPQRTYIVEAGGIRILHAGDTMNHGYWWAIGQRAGSISVAFVPINAPVVNLPHLQPPSPFHAVMSPEEAAVAAKIVGANTVVPIHHGGINVPNIYVETENHLNRFKRRAEQLDVRSYLPHQGDWFPAKEHA